jgi:fluoroquinolone transport system ATP-binding protein
MINVNNLTFTYTGTTEPAVRGLNFNIEEGEIFGFLGPSGAGKSTTQKILIGLLQDYKGEAAVMDTNISAWGSDYYQHIGVSFEIPNHYQKLTGIENLTYFGSLYGDGAQDPQALLESVGLENDGDTLVSQYSKGMKNRLTVARSMVHNPRLLFLDEPTAGLDPVNARRIKDLIQTQKEQGKTIFLTTHDMMVADELCDRVAFIVDGQISLIDSPRSLKLQHGRPFVKVEFLDNGSTDFQDFPLEGLADNQDFNTLLRERNVQTIHTQEATLETIFIQVTGRRLT